MRKLTKVLLAMTAAAWLLVGVGPDRAAHALSMTPDPVQYVSGSGVEADVSLISASGDTITLEVTVHSGSLSGVDVSMLFDASFLPVASVAAASTLETGGVDATAVVASGATAGNFDFQGGLGAGQTSDHLVVQYAATLLAGWQGQISFHHGGGGDEGFVLAVPEPGLAALLLGAGLLTGAARTARRPRA